MHDVKNGEIEKVDSKVTEKRIYRSAGIKDVDGIYESIFLVCETKKGILCVGRAKHLSHSLK